jgi:hypothetical protein
MAPQKSLGKTMTSIVSKAFMTPIYNRAILKKMLKYSTTIKSLMETVFILKTNAIMRRRQIKLK